MTSDERRLIRYDENPCSPFAALKRATKARGGPNERVSRSERARSFSVPASRTTRFRGLGGAFGVEGGGVGDLPRLNLKERVRRVPALSTESAHNTTREQKPRGGLVPAQG